MIAQPTSKSTPRTPPAQRSGLADEEVYAENRCIPFRRPSNHRTDCWFAGGRVAGTLRKKPRFSTPSITGASAARNSPAMPLGIARSEKNGCPVAKPSQLDGPDCGIHHPTVRMPTMRACRSCGNESGLGWIGRLFMIARHYRRPMLRGSLPVTDGGTPCDHDEFWRLRGFTGSR